MHSLSIVILSLIIILLGFYDDEETCTFGSRKKGGERVPHLDFNFKLISKVVAAQGSTGYLAEVTTEKIEGQSQSRLYSN